MEVLLRPDGTEESAEVAFGPDGAVEVAPRDARAVFLGDAFLYAEQFDNLQDSSIQVVRIELDGTARPATTPAGTASRWPNLARANGQIALSYGDLGWAETVTSVPLDSFGAAAGAATQLPIAYQSVPLMSLGGSVQGVLSLPPLSAFPLGNPSNTMVIGQVPNVIETPLVVPDGDDAIVAWLDESSYSSRFGVVRVRP
jgi:hypothetical protein